MKAVRRSIRTFEAGKSCHPRPTPKTHLSTADPLLAPLPPRPDFAATASRPSCYLQAFAAAFGQNFAATTSRPCCRLQTLPPFPGPPATVHGPSTASRPPRRLQSLRPPLELAAAPRASHLPLELPPASRPPRCSQALHCEPEKVQRDRNAPIPSIEKHQR
jgi:hypothetical protein